MINKQFEKYLSNEPPGEIILRGANIGRYEFYEVPKQGSPVYLNKEKYLEERGNDSDGKHAEILASVEACLPKDEAGNFIVSQEKSDVVHDSPGLPGGEDAGDEPGRSKRDQADG